MDISQRLPVAHIACMHYIYLKQKRRYLRAIQSITVWTWIFKKDLHSWDVDFFTISCYPSQFLIAVTFDNNIWSNGFNPTRIFSGVCGDWWMYLSIHIPLEQQMHILITWILDILERAESIDHHYSSATLNSRFKLL